MAGISTLNPQSIPSRARNAIRYTIGTDKQRLDRELFDDFFAVSVYIQLFLHPYIFSSSLMLLRHCASYEHSSGSKEDLLALEQALIV